MVSNTLGTNPRKFRAPVYCMGQTDGSFGTRDTMSPKFEFREVADGIHSEEGA